MIFLKLKKNFLLKLKKKLVKSSHNDVIDIIKLGTRMAQRIEQHINAHVKLKGQTSNYAVTDKRL